MWLTCACRNLQSLHLASLYTSCAGQLSECVLTLKTDQLQLSLCVRTERDCNRGACIVFILESPQQSAQSQLVQSSQNCKLFVCFQSNIKVLTQTPQPDARTSQAASRPKLSPSSPKPSTLPFRALRLVPKKEGKESGTVSNCLLTILRPLLILPASWLKRVFSSMRMGLFASRDLMLRLNHRVFACLTLVIRPLGLLIALNYPRMNLWLCVGLGRCDCSPHSEGRRIQFPAFCPQGELLVLAGCLHNLGHKKVTTAKVDNNILTPDSAVISFTICKDEVSHEKCKEIRRSPVKTVLGLCGGDLTLLAPPLE